MQCLETAFELSPEDVESLSVSKSLLDIFQETVAAETPAVSGEAKSQAEKLKNEGNNLMKSEQFTEALQCYSKYYRGKAIVSNAGCLIQSSLLELSNWTEEMPFTTAIVRLPTVN